MFGAITAGIKLVAGLVGIGKSQQEANVRKAERQAGAETQRGKDAEAEAEERRKEHGVAMEQMDVTKVTDTARDLADD